MSYRAYLAFKNHQILPHDFMALSREEQAFILACEFIERDEQKEALDRERRRVRRR